MSHDFAKQRAARASRASKPPVSAWVWFLGGIAVGVFASFLVYLTTIAPPPRKAQSAETQPKQAPDAATRDASTNKPPATRPQFDFYTLLPESEVMVGERRTVDSAKKPSAAATSPAALLLQAGSFRALAEADRRRGEILLLGFDASVETVNVDGEGTWYRVQVGPFPSAEAMGKARRALLEQHIDTLEISKRSP